MMEVASTTHIGNRSENQDAVEICKLETGTLAILADGAGGHQDGALAAQSLCRHIASTASEHIAELSAIGFCKEPASSEACSATDLFRNIIRLAAAAMGREVRAVNPQTNAHTTMVLCWVSKTATLFAHIGDSRAYLIDKSGIAFCSRDHSMAQWMFEQGEITEDQLRVHPDRHRLYKMISTDKPARPTIHLKPAMGIGQFVLLCSDGWWEHIPSQEIRSLSHQDRLAPWLDQRAALAVERANGRSDNVTAIAIRRS